MHLRKTAVSSFLSLLSLAALSHCASGNPSPKQPGIGFEFGCSGLLLHSAQCTEDQYANAKGKVLDGRIGTNWESTGDVSPGVPGQCVPEYILKGENIKLGKGMAVPVAKAVSENMVSKIPTWFLVHSALCTKPLPRYQIAANVKMLFRPTGSQAPKRCKYKM